MERKSVLAHLLRALSGLKLEEVAEARGVTKGLIGHYERGRVVPGEDYLDYLAAEAGITLGEGEELLRLYEAFRQSRQARGRGADALLDRLAQNVRAHAEAVYRRVLRLPLPGGAPAPGDRRQAEELWAHLMALPEGSRAALVQVAEEFQGWALCERACAESVKAASCDVEQSAGLARLAQEIAERVQGPAGWRDRLRGYAAAHAANVLRVSGALKAAEAAFVSAKRLWQGGADPDALLDPGRLPDLEASLRRDQRRCTESLVLLDEALAIGRSPARVLVQKGFTLEVMGEYERSTDTLLQAAPVVEATGDERLQYMWRFNLAVNCCHQGLYRDAGELVRKVREMALERGDDIELLRVTWLEGRIAAGLGQTGEARRLLGQARRDFAARGMDYDVALALLEEAGLLLAEGRSAEVKNLALELARVFKSKEVHAEAQSALRLFRRAAEREEATAELARRVLRYLFRARFDQGVRFEGS